MREQEAVLPVVEFLPECPICGCFLELATMEDDTGEVEVFKCAECGFKEEI